MITSGVPIGKTMVGLDKFGYNLAEMSASGPIAWRKDAEGNRTDPLLGLFLSGNYTYQTDTRPTFGGVYRMTDAARIRRQSLASKHQLFG